MTGPDPTTRIPAALAALLLAASAAVPAGARADTVWRCRTAQGDEGFFINTKPTNAKCKVYAGARDPEPRKAAKGAKCRALRFHDTVFYRCEKDGVTWVYNTPIEPPAGGTAAAASDTGAAPARLGGREGPGTELAALVTRASAESGIPEALLKAVIEVESGFRPDVVSPAGAQGLMQLMPMTADGLEVEDPFDPEQNVRAGARLLRQLSDRFTGDLERTIAAYYAGATAVRRAGGAPDTATEAYVRKVLDRYRKYAALEPGVH